MSYDEPRDKGPLESDETTRRSPRRKDTKRWCRGKVNVEHVPQVVVDKGRQHLRSLRGMDSCRWSVWYVRGGLPKPHYSCDHREECKNCGKVLDVMWGTPAYRAKCPDFRELPDYPVEDYVCQCGEPWRNHIVDGTRGMLRRCPNDESKWFDWEGVW